MRISAEGVWMPAKYKILGCVASAVFFLDQLTKYFVLKTLARGEFIPIISGYLDLVHVRNPGAAFGMLSGLPAGIRDPFFYLVTFVAVIILIYAFRRMNAVNRFYIIPLSLISGGVMGNFVDRVRFGNVVDFVSVHIRDKIIWNISLEWPAFNVADAAITVSMVWIMIHILRGR